MITKPSLADLIEGITANAERHILPALGGTPAAQLLVDSLATLDRLAAEWSATSANLAADNDDIRDTLARIGRPVVRRRLGRRRRRGRRRAGGARTAG